MKVLEFGVWLLFISPVCVVDGDVCEENLEVDDVLRLPPDLALPLARDLVDALAVPDQQLGHVHDQLSQGGNHLDQRQIYLMHAEVWSKRRAVGCVITHPGFLWL